MIGADFIPGQCVFIVSAPLNSNQFDENVPDANNPIPCNLLWNFVENKLQYVNTLTNKILRELAGGSGGAVNDLLANFAENLIINFDVTNVNTALGNNNIVCPAGTYYFDLTYDYIPDIAGAELMTAEIRTNTNTLLTAVDPTDVIRGNSKSKITEDPGVTIRQTVVTEKVTMAVPFILKSAFSVTVNAAFTNNMELRAFKLIV